MGIRSFLNKVFFACLLSLPAYADQVAVNQFIGLNNDESSVIIGPEYAQDTLNVEVTGGGKSIKKRAGYGTYKDIGDGSLHGGHHSFDSVGNDVQIWGSSVSLWGIVADGTPKQLVSSATLNSTWDCADVQGNNYCVNSNRDAFIRTDGTTINWYTSPLGTMVTSTPDRLVVAGLSGAPSSLYVSESNNFTNFTVANLDSSPFIEPIAAPGSKLTHTRWGCGKLLWWKDQSFGYTNFETQYVLENKIISDTIGTFDNTSAVDPGGNVWFRGQDGHIWKYDCSGLTKESIDITPNIQSSGRRTENSWTQTTNSDFSAGFLSSMTVGSNSIYLTTTNVTAVLNNSFENGTLPPTDWTYANFDGNGTFSSDSPGTSCSCVPTPVDGSRVGTFSTAHTGGATYTANIVDVNVSSTILKSISITNDGACSTSGTVWTTSTITMDGTVAGKVVKVMLRQVGKNSLFQNQDYRVYSSTFIMSNNVQLRTLSSKFNYAGTCDQNLVYFDNITGGSNSILTGSFYSTVKNSPNLSTWGTFNAGYQDGGGTQSFFLRSSTETFDIASSTPSWVAQTPGAVVSASTGTYFQVRDDFSISIATQVPVLNDFTVNWLEGTAADQAYMHYFENAIWTSVAFGVGASSNTHIFRRDLINDGWTIYNIGNGGMLTQGNRLYFGDISTDGGVFIYGSGLSDNGAMIESYWKSKDFSSPDPFLEMSLSQIDVFSKKDQSQALTAVYTLNTSTSTSYQINLSSTTQSFVQSRKLLPSGKNGYFFNLQLGDLSGSSSWEVLGYRVGFNILPYRPTN